MAATITLDLHNHSACSYDASARFTHYRSAARRGLFDVLAITDHNTTKAKKSFLNDEFRVIIGEEIDTKDGELIGLFLDSKEAGDVPTHRSALDTAKEIQARGGLVYLQHPYYRWLKKPHRMHEQTILHLMDARAVDIVEVANAGPLMSESNRRARVLAQQHDIPMGAGSDAHHATDIARAVVRIPRVKDPFDLTNEDLVNGLRAGSVDTHRIRPSVLTLSVRVGYAVHVGYGRLSGGERKLREPHQDWEGEIPPPSLQT